MATKKIKDVEGTEVVQPTREIVKPKVVRKRTPKAKQAPEVELPIEQPVEVNSSRGSKKINYYTLDAIKKRKADYNIIFGERSNGKTYATLRDGIKTFVETGKQMAYIRRWREDLRGKRGENLFTNHVVNGVIEDLTDGKFNEVFYMSNRWWLSFFDRETNKRYPDSEPFCFGFALSETEHEKSSSYPNVTTIVFDEFLTRRLYLPDEFMLFMNTLSTIIRQRNDVTVYMLGNTVNKYCPYFAEMGLDKIVEMEQGTIDLYQFGKGGAIVAVEYCSSIATEKESNKYFCFGNQNLQMITGGKWELAVYPHLPTKYKPKDVLFVYYIKFNDVILQGNIIQVGNDNFTYIHIKSTPIKDLDNSLIYSLEMNGKPNYKRKLISSATYVEQQVARYFAIDKVFYQNNEVGEVVRNYLLTSSKTNIVATL